MWSSVLSADLDDPVKKMVAQAMQKSNAGRWYINEPELQHRLNKELGKDAEISTLAERNGTRCGFVRSDVEGRKWNHTTAPLIARQHKNGNHFFYVKRV